MGIFWSYAYKHADKWATQAEKLGVTNKEKWEEFAAWLVDNDSTHITQYNVDI